MLVLLLLLQFLPCLTLIHKLEVEVLFYLLKMQKTFVKVLNILKHKIILI